MPSTNYIIAAAVILALGLGLIFLPEKTNRKQVQPAELLQEFQNEKRYVSVDQLTEMMINEDPSLILVDVRDTDSYEAFSLPGAINIPLAQILDEEWDDYFDREELEIVFYSNDHLLAEQAWMLKKRQEVHNTRILKGGLNQWTRDILLAEEPAATAPSEAFERYSFLLGARKYFVGASRPIDPGEIEPIAKPQAKKTIPVIPKKAPVEEEEEGC